MESEVFKRLLYQANEQFTPHFFGKGTVKEQLLEAYNYYRSKKTELDTQLEYADIKEDIEKRNELLKAANENNKELEEFKKKLEDAEKKLKEEQAKYKIPVPVPVSVPAAPKSIQRDIDPNIILPDVATMSTTIIDNTNI